MKNILNLYRDGIEKKVIFPNDELIIIEKKNKSIYKK
jgi:hypothetical protein